LPPEFRQKEEEKNEETGQRTLTRRDFVKIAGAAAAVGAGVAMPKVLEAAGRKTKIDPPIITCAGSEQDFIDIQVCAPSGTGATGCRPASRSSG
jgi:hypothetical protein